ncbi:MAG TPA: sigma-54 dependent transcriptional regulator [Acidobacteriaceae bacterium]|jgi:formate hydrogenlyase transcriptional activator|nr:sigma-54 dependent transcriptional regulator [Acidobacteriaceae bacterium]
MVPGNTFTIDQTADAGPGGVTERGSAATFDAIVGQSSALTNVLQEVGLVAPTDTTVLVLGETGTGKELIAQAIHNRSGRAGRPFIRVNCAAIPPSLIPSELFGHEKGAFTGALQRRMGRFESAHRGTIFLDEVGELPMETQISLLRVIQERELERIGSSVPVKVDVRIIAATNRDLSEAVKTGTFREDLYYRLNVFPIHVPALRERLDDIPLLVEHFVAKFAARAGRRFRAISPAAIEQLQAWPWPGNIRELQNVIERAVILCEGDVFSVEESWLERAPVRPRRVAPPLAAALADREREMIEAALAESRGRIAGPSGAAVKLGMPRQTLDSRIASLRISKHQFKAAPAR